MKKALKTGLMCMVFALIQPAWGGAVSVYSTLPDPALPDEFSIGYQDTQTAEFGALIQVAGNGPVDLGSATVAVSNWGYESLYEAVGTSPGFFLALTLNLYNIGVSDNVGSVIDSVTTTAFIPWRPEPDPTDCGAASTDYLAGDGGCYPGALSTVSFDLGGILVPNEFIYGFAFNTQNSGASPYNVPGPFNTLHFAISGDSPDPGVNPMPDTAYWNTSYGPNYHDGGAGGVGVFRPDQGWAPFSGAIEFDSVASPEPSTLSLLALSLIVFVAFALRPKSLQK